MSADGFSGRVILVTGASGALGKAVVAGFLSRGAAVAATDRNPDKLAAAYPDGTWKRACDLSDGAAVAALTAAVASDHGRLDVLVNCHGVYRGGTPVHETPLDAWDQVVDANARSIFHTCRAAIPHMLGNGGGKIVNVAARAALAGAAGLGPYSAAKSAVVRLTESLAAELKALHVNVNCILPGTIDTPANRQSSPGADASRWVPPEALAEVILFLASDAARAVHGAALPVYGLS